MPQFSPAVSKILTSINRYAAVTCDDPKHTGEWFYLESQTLSDMDLFNKLRTNWSQIDGIDALHFALIYCQGDPDGGVWLHHLRTLEAKVEYQTGCHCIPSWY